MAATRQLPDREYIKPDTKFAVTLGARQDVAALKAATAAFWLLANLGALGARANRGAGSFQVQRVDSQGDEIAFRVCQSVDELQSYLTNGLQQCLAAIGDGKAQWRAFQGAQSSYDVTAPDTVKIWIVANTQGGWSSLSDALNGIGEKMRDYRSHRKTVGRADHDAVLRWLEEGGASPQIKRAAFGLPIPFRYSDGGPSDVIQADGSERRASPLRIRITRLTTGKYVGVITLFEARFLEEGKNLMLQTRKRKAPPPTNYKVIEDFIETFALKRRVEL
jgi:CRISPR/Cas system CMR-associated protein Cmr1 (group 7 of RAMP superfamily)